MQEFDEISHLISLHAEQQMRGREPFGIGHVIAYNPATNEVQVAFPGFPLVDATTGQTTGTYSISPWMQLGSPWVGNGWGMQVAPEVGDATAPWNGTQCAVYIIHQESSAGLVGELLYNNNAVPPDSTLVAGEAVLKHKSGTKIKFHESGELEVYCAANISITTGAGIQYQFNTSGSIAITLPSGQTFSINGSADALALVSKLVSAFNGHTHDGVQTGSGTSGTPVTSWSASTIESAIVQVGS